MSTKISFIHTGDIHLGLKFNNVSFSKDKAIARRNELWQTFQSIISYAMEKKVDFLFIAGDLYERDYFTLGDMKRVSDLLSMAADINVLISAGNHDSLYGGSLYNKVEWSDNVTIFSDEGIQKKYFKALNTTVYGYSWSRLEFRENTLFSELKIHNDYKNILLLHGDVSSKSNYLPLSIKDLENLDMDYIALGHIHKPNIFNNKIAYSGCPEPLDFSEDGGRGFIEGEIHQKGTTIEFIPFNKRTFHNIELEIDGKDSYLDIVNKIKDHKTSSDDFYRFRIKGYHDKDLDMDSIINQVEDCFYHIELIDESTPDYDLELLQIENKNNIIGRYIETMNQKGLKDEIVRDSLYRGLKVLLEGSR